MGCTSSKVEDGAQARPVKTAASLVDPSTMVWTAEDSYAKFVQKHLEKSIASGREGDMETFYSEESTSLRALAWLKDRFPYIDGQDRIFEAGKIPYSLGGQYPVTEMWIGASSEGPGVAALYLVHTHKENDGSPDKATRNEAIMSEAQDYIISLLNRAFSNIAQHMQVCVIVENDVTMCRPYPNSEVMIEPIPHTVSREEQKWHKSVSKHIKVYGEEAIGGFNKLYFDKLVGELCRLRRGISVWDDDELAFNVNGKPYQWGSRLLVGRVESKMKTLKGIKATHFKVKHPFGSDDQPPTFLFKMLEGSVDPGGVEIITLFVATDPSILWPKVGQFKNSPALKAAETALMERLKQMHKQGLMSLCRVRLQMGQEQKSWIFVGHDWSKDQPTTTSESTSSDHPSPVGNLHLASIGIDLEEQPQGMMYNEQGDFQGIFGHLRERFMDNPRTAEIHDLASLRTMHTFLGLSFPGTQVSDQGELVVPAQDDAEKAESQTLKGSHLFVVRDPAQAPKDVVGVAHIMALPDGVKPTGHYEDSQFIKDGESALLKVMKKMYENGEISGKECTAIVQASFDTNIYQFVEGNKFVDYSETQMLRFQCM